MHKKDKRTPEEIAKDLESIDFAEIEEADLQEVFGALEETEDHCNSSCNINNACDES